ncbi:MAG: response regulator transcription factor [Candidatus Rokubacteria bacterium]|nr:response regulator transcription factor [Candidatus Rokubacteria bacterium]
MSKIRIVVVDDHEVVRHGLRLSLELEADMVVVGEARTGEEAVTVALQKRPDVLLLDARLGDVDGPEVCRQVRAVAPNIAILMLSSYLQDGLVLRSLVAGAKGYISKDVELADLKKIIRSVYRGNAVLDPKVTKQLISTATGESKLPKLQERLTKGTVSLTETDLLIMRHLASGLTNKEIAAMVHLSPYTVKDHLLKICSVLNARSRTEVVAEALRRGLI